MKNQSTPVQCALAAAAAATLALAPEARADRILYGVPKVAYGPAGVTAFPMCVRACDQFLGGETTYDFVMAASGAAFRLTWDTTEWNGGNVWDGHSFDDPAKMFTLGFASIGRTHETFAREPATREEFFAFIKKQIDLGNPCVAFGVIGPPEACIIAGYKDDGMALLGWNFFQDFIPTETDHNGYFITRGWWDNKDTFAVLSFAEKDAKIPGFADIVRNAVEVLSPRRHGVYAKGLMAYDAWKKSMQDEAEFSADLKTKGLEDRLMCQDDAMNCLQDGRHNAALFFRNAAKENPQHAEACNAIATHFEEVRAATMKMAQACGGWFGRGERMKRVADPETRRQICALIDEAKAADEKAFEKMKELSGALNP